TATFNSVSLGNPQTVAVINFALQLAIGTTTPQQTPDNPAAPGSPTRVRIGGNVLAANLLNPVDPVSPDNAKEARIQGVVVLEAEINKMGEVTNLKVITGHPFLIQSAIDAVKQWTYKPVMLNGEPVDVVSTMTINFTNPN